MELVVEDANILIDLFNTGLYQYCHRLSISFHTTDIVRQEIKDPRQREMLENFIVNKMIEVDSMDGADGIELMLAIAEYKRKCNLSPGDCSVMLLAKKLHCRLLTTDQKLKRQAEAIEVQVNGFLWLIDLMVEKEIVSHKEMITYLERYLATNDRAPRKLIEERIAKYNDYVE